MARRSFDRPPPPLQRLELWRAPGGPGTYPDGVARDATAPVKLATTRGRVADAQGSQEHGGLGMIDTKRRREIEFPASRATAHVVAGDFVRVPHLGLWILAQDVARAGKMITIRGEERNDNPGYQSGATWPDAAYAADEADGGAAGAGPVQVDDDPDRWMTVG